MPMGVAVAAAVGRRALHTAAGPAATTSATTKPDTQGPDTVRCDITFQPTDRAATSGGTPAGAAPSAPSSSPSRSSFLVVEYPGFVENVSRAIDHLQGESSIQQILTAPDPLLKLNFRPSDPNSHPLFGEVHTDLLTKPLPPSGATTARKMENSATGAPSGEHSFEYVVRVTRRRHRPSAGGGPPAAPEVRAEWLGQVATSVSFHGLCDFQLLQPTAPEIDLDMPQLWPTALTASSAPGHAPIPDAYLPNRPGSTILAPLLFSRYDYTREYNFANHENSNAAFRAAAYAAATRHQQGESEDEEKAPTPSKAHTPAAPASTAAKKKRIRSPTIKAKPSPAAAMGVDAPAGEGAGADESEEEAEDDDDEEDEEEIEHAGEDAAMEGAADTSMRKRRARRYFEPYSLDRTKYPVKTGPDPGTAFATSEFQSRPAVIVLKQCFSQRPIWSADALVLRLEEEQRSAFWTAPKLTRQELLHHLVAVAFRFSKGPWRNLWIAYGYDPRDRARATQARMYTTHAHSTSRPCEHCRLLVDGLLTGDPSWWSVCLCLSLSLPCLSPGCKWSTFV